MPKNSISKRSRNIPMNTLMLKTMKLVRWDPNKKHPGGNLFYQYGVEPIVSPSCPPIDSQLPQWRIQFCRTKRMEMPHQSYCFFLEGSSNNRKEWISNSYFWRQWTVALQCGKKRRKGRQGDGEKTRNTQGTSLYNQRVRNTTWWHIFWPPSKIKTNFKTKNKTQQVGASEQAEWMNMDGFQ